ncbi:MAG: DNA-3-methyladenine glycosylase 2 family protein, partial [Parasporobacterium sp.]|nr:DNA-3-methyladenine glycosylase 2 family protein [Parasporobacterium sp.]
IKKKIVDAAPELKPIVDEYYGIRILNQEFVETLISFIISQNSNIPRIRKTVREISKTYGKLIDEADGACSFPDIEALDSISEQDYRNLKTGFRAAYLRDAVNRLISGEIDENELKNMDFRTAKNTLMTIKGVGDKVANCVLLFGLGFRNAFPVDVWIKRIMEELYFGRDTDKTVIENYAADKFGELGGYAQQYLFIYAKNK